MDLVPPKDFLRAFPDAKSLDPADLRELLAQTTTVRVLENSVLFDTGDTPDSAYLVLGGRVRVERLLDSGQRVPLGLLARGHIVGDMGLIDGEPRSASAVVDEDLLALRLDQEAWRGLREEGHPAALWLLREIQRRMSRRVHRTYDRIARLRAEPELAQQLPADEPAPRRWFERWMDWWQR